MADGNEDWIKPLVDRRVERDGVRRNEEIQGGDFTSRAEAFFDRMRRDLQQVVRTYNEHDGRDLIQVRTDNDSNRPPGLTIQWLGRKPLVEWRIQFLPWEPPNIPPRVVVTIKDELHAQQADETYEFRLRPDGELDLMGAQGEPAHAARKLLTPWLDRL